jgi:two-component system, OmpR family, response regulator
MPIYSKAPSEVSMSRAVTPRVFASNALSVRFGEFELNLRTRRLRRNNAGQIALSNGEFNLLVALLASPERILSRDQLPEASRVYDNEV